MKIDSDVSIKRLTFEIIFAYIINDNLKFRKRKKIELTKNLIN